MKPDLVEKNYHLNFTFTLSSFLAAAGVTVDTFKAELDIPIPGLDKVQPWIPKLNVGGDSVEHNIALEVSFSGSWGIFKFYI